MKLLYCGEIVVASVYVNLGSVTEGCVINLTCNKLAAHGCYRNRFSYERVCVILLLGLEVVLLRL